MYPNFPDPDPTDWTHAFYGTDTDPERTGLPSRRGRAPGPCGVGYPWGIAALLLDQNGSPILLQEDGVTSSDFRTTAS